MINAPIQSLLPVDGASATWTSPWANWFQRVAAALGGWTRAYSATATLNFPSTGSGAESVLTVPVAGAVIGNGVLVQAAGNTAGIVWKGDVTTDGVVNVRALNVTTGAIDPAAQSITVVVLAQ